MPKRTKLSLRENNSMDLRRREIITEAVKDFFKQNCNSSIYKSDENLQQQEDAADTATQDKVRPSFCAGLLAEAPSSPDDNDEEIFKSSQYPKYPLYLEVAFGICKWLENGCPFTRRISMPLLNEEVSREKREKLCEECEPIVNRIKNFFERNEFDNEDNEDVETGNKVAGISKTKAPKLVKLSAEFDSFKDISKRMDPLAEDETLISLVHNLLCVLKEQGILHILGIRETAGSLNALPPPSSVLLDSFIAKHNEKSKLTVGARALSKHFHRCQTSSWWGDCKGTEAKKNEHALDVLKMIVEDCVWINIHGLPHDVKIIELR